jgi:hypothetical protein
MPILECRRVVFFSQGDEAAFFRQLELNKGVRRVEGIGDSLLLHTSAVLAEQSLRDLLATFRRYEIRMDQFAQFSSDKNRHWFEDPKAYWFRDVFGKVGRRARRPG